MIKSFNQYSLNQKIRMTLYSPDFAAESVLSSRNQRTARSEFLFGHDPVRFGPKNHRGNSTT